MMMCSFIVCLFVLSLNVTIMLLLIKPFFFALQCEKCGYTQDDVHTKILPSIPAVPEDFNMREPCFVRNCFECQAPNQRMMMKFEGCVLLCLFKM